MTRKPANLIAAEQNNDQSQKESVFHKDGNGFLFYVFVILFLNGKDCVRKLHWVIFDLWDLLKWYCHEMRMGVITGNNSKVGRAVVRGFPA